MFQYLVSHYVTNFLPKTFVCRDQVRGQMVYLPKPVQMNGRTPSQGGHFTSVLIVEISQLQPFPNSVSFVIYLTSRRVTESFTINVSCLHLMLVEVIFLPTNLLWSLRLHRVKSVRTDPEDLYPCSYLSRSVVRTEKRQKESPMCQRGKTKRNL